MCWPVWIDIDRHMFNIHCGDLLSHRSWKEEITSILIEDAKLFREYKSGDSVDFSVWKQHFVCALSKNKHLERLNNVPRDCKTYKFLISRNSEFPLGGIIDIEEPRDKIMGPRRCGAMRRKDYGATHRGELWSHGETEHPPGQDGDVIMVPLRMLHFYKLFFFKNLLTYFYLYKICDRLKTLLNNHYWWKDAYRLWVPNIVICYVKKVIILFKKYA